MLDIDILRTFHTVARLGRFNDAARHLNRSTSAVSVHIQRLERETGARVFRRNNAGVELSDHGRFILAETAELLREHQRVLGALAGEPIAAKIRFGICEEHAAGVVADMLPSFALRHPRIEIELDVGSSRDLAYAFDRGRLDAAVTIEAHCDPAGTLGPVRPIWACGRDTGPPSASPLPIALHAKGCPYRDLAEAALRESGLAWRPMITSGSSAAIAAAIERGLCVGILDRRSVRGVTREVPVEVGLAPLPAFHANYRSRIDGTVGNVLKASLASHFADDTGYGPVTARL